MRLFPIAIMVMLLCLSACGKKSPPQISPAHISDSLGAHGFNFAFVDSLVVIDDELSYTHAESSTPKVNAKFKPCQDYAWSGYVNASLYAPEDTAALRFMRTFANAISPEVGA